MHPMRHILPRAKGLGAALLSDLKYSLLPYGKIADREQVGARRSKKKGESKSK